MMKSKNENLKTHRQEIEIVTPIRDQQLTRQQEIEYLQSFGIKLSWDKARYSVNKGFLEPG